MVRSRRSARELVLRALYAIELTGKSVAEVLTESLIVQKASGPPYEFGRKLLETTATHHEEFDAYIRAKALNWEFARIAVIDKLVLRMALCELLYFEDIPPKVSIDEAIEVTRKYSTDKSDKFVNGILDAILADLRRSGKIIKKGRGLMMESRPEITQ